MTPKLRNADPFSWWGPGWQTPVPRGIDELLRDGTIDLWSAANLWAALQRRSSIAVVAGPSGVGKTTLLTALLDFLPAETRRIYPRGCFETFAFLSDATVVARETALLINEISPHLPVYLWGPAVGRVLEAAERGFLLLATAHGGTVQEFVGALTGSPLRIPASRVGAFNFVVVMEQSAESQSGRQVRGVWRLGRTPAGVTIEAMQAVIHDISHEIPTIATLPTTWFPIQELAQRLRTLQDLRERRIEQLPLLQ